MADLRQQAQAIINVCKTAVAGEKDPLPVDNQTIAIAQALLAEAKSALPDDKVLASVNLDPPIPFWTTVQTAMEMVLATMPTPENIGLAERMRDARKRVEAYEKPLYDAIAEYKTALETYEQSSQTEQPSYSAIEIAKMKIADAVLEKRGIPTKPNTLEKAG